MVVLGGHPLRQPSLYANSSTVILVCNTHPDTHPFLKGGVEGSTRGKGAVHTPDRKGPSGTILTRGQWKADHSTNVMPPPGWLTSCQPRRSVKRLPNYSYTCRRGDAFCRRHTSRPPALLCTDAVRRAHQGEVVAALVISFGQKIERLSVPVKLDQLGSTIDNVRAACEPHPARRVL